jgi:tetratricopeptide (TPR) repeat protein
MAAGRWDEATATFEELVRRGDDPDAWEGLAVAARWRGDLARAVVAREHAYRLFRSAGDDESAARVAALLALDVAESSGASAVAAGWLARARDLLRDRPESTWHAVVEGVEGAVAGVYERDFGRARRLLESAVAASGAGGDLDSELLDNPRTDHASLLTWRGQYVEAEQELRLVLEQARGWSRPVALARLYLAELDRRRGRLDAAYTLWLAAGELFRNAGTPREVAACEREAGWCQHLLGHSEGATRVRSARAELAALGAEGEAARADRLLVEIAARLVLSVRTVEQHLANLYQRRNRSGCRHAGVWALHLLASDASEGTGPPLIEEDP